MKRLNFKPGKILDEFDVVKDGKKLHVVFRYPRLSDVDGLLRFINAVMRESEFLRPNKRITKEEELKWLRSVIGEMKNGNSSHVAVEINDRISGGGGVSTMNGASSHVGGPAIALRDKYTNLGIGTRLMGVLMGEARKLGVEVMKLSVFEKNVRAQHLYKKLGFKRVGVVPKTRKSKDGSYQGEVIMYKIIA